MASREVDAGSGGADPRLVPHHSCICGSKQAHGLALRIGTATPARLSRRATEATDRHAHRLNCGREHDLDPIREAFLADVRIPIQNGH